MGRWSSSTLKRRVRAEQKEWLTKNEIHRRLTPHFIRRWLLGVASRPIVFSITLFLIVAAASLLIEIHDPYWQVLLPPDKIADSVAYFSALWSVQSALVALLYPIVIAFVALLVDRGNRTSTSLNIYLHDSAALLAGLSALFLVGTMGVQYLFIPFVVKSVLVAWAALDAIWFVLNLFLTGHFLVRTFAFIDSAQRFKITQAYVLTVSWPPEMRTHLTGYMFNHAVEEGMLPGPNSRSAPRNSPTVLMGNSWNRAGQSAGVDVKIKRPLELVDVRFWLLRPVLRRWLRRASKVAPGEGIIPSHPVFPIIAFPIHPFIAYGDNFRLCAVSDTVPLSWTSRTLIRWSFRFRKPLPARQTLSAGDVMTDLQKLAAVAIRAGEPESFEQELQRMVDLYASLVGASAVNSTTGKASNLILVADRTSWLGQPLYRSLAMRFFELFEAGAEKLSVERRYVNALIHVPRRLFAHAKDDSSEPAVLKSFVSMYPPLLAHIEHWWVRTLESQKGERASNGAPAILRPPEFGAHDVVIGRLMGAWENLQHDCCPPRAPNPSSWRAAQHAARCLETHLAQTLVMLFDVVRRGDEAAAFWLADFLVRWHGELQAYLDDESYALPDLHPLFNFEWMERDWETIERAAIGDASLFSPALSFSAVLNTCLRTLWQDAVSMALFLLAEWEFKVADGSLTAPVFAALAQGRGLKAGGHTTAPPYQNPHDLLRCIVRQQFVLEGEKPLHRHRLDGYMNDIAMLTRDEKTMNGRVYSVESHDSLFGLKDGRLVALMLTSATPWIPKDRLQGVLKNAALSDLASEGDIRAFLYDWRTRLTQPAFAERAPAYGRLAARIDGAGDFETTRKNVLDGLDHLLAFLSNT